MLGWVISSSFVCFGQRQERLSWYLAHVQVGRDFVHNKNNIKKRQKKKQQTVERRDLFTKPAMSTRFMKGPLNGDEKKIITYNKAHGHKFW